MRQSVFFLSYIFSLIFEFAKMVYKLLVLLDPCWIRGYVN